MSVEDPTTSEESQRARFTFFIEREIEKVDSFYERKAKEIIQYAKPLLRASSSGEDALRVAWELFPLEDGTSTVSEEFLESDGINREALLVEHIEECRLQIRKVLQFCSLNIEGFRKALKKFDKNHAAAAHNLTSMLLPRVKGSAFAFPSKLQSLETSLQGCLELLVGTAATPKGDRRQTLAEIRRIWDDIYNVQVKTILERDDANALVEATRSLKLEDNSQLFPEDAPSGPEVILRREQQVFFNALIQGICSNKAISCLRKLLQYVPDLSRIERQLNISTLQRVLETSADARDVDMLELLIQGGADPSWRDVKGRGLVYLAIATNKFDCLIVLLGQKSASYARFDNSGCAPIYFAILRGNELIVRALLDQYELDGKQVVLLENAPLDPMILASKSGHIDVLKLLIDKGFGLDLQDSDGETPLYHCTKRNHLECMELILNKGGNTEIPENYEGWTPLFIAAITGSQPSIECLLSHGAQKNRTDLQGWLPFEHATFRGFHLLGRMLKPEGIDPASKVLSTSVTGKILCEKESEYGHAYLQGQYQLRLSLGHLSGPRSTKPAIEILDRPIATGLNYICRIHPSNPKLGDATELDIPLRDEPSVIKYALFKDGACLFSLWDQLEFDILERGPNTSEITEVGTGRLMLTNVVQEDGRPLFKGSKQYIVPIFGPQKRGQPIAIASCEILIACPFFLAETLLNKKIYWKSVSTKVIGHRGLGANAGIPYPQIGENTVLSFVMAASLGAEYVEFDVQLTKDKVPVLYHDFIVSETGLQIPTSALTLKQFLDLRDHLSKRRLESVKMRYSTLDDSMTLRAAYKKIIEGPFATLKEAFRTVPLNIGFNIELKYPTSDEFEAEGMQHVFEINEFCDHILAVAFTECQDRPLIFSSFHPDICLLLSLKQTTFPVFFLTEGGMTHLPNEPRANSLHQAIRFAKEASLLGICCNSTPLLLAPKLIKVVKENCLLLFTYGPRNNEVDSVQLQTKYGVDAVIVDSVARIRRGLQ